MWFALILACTMPEEEDVVPESAVALDWGSANRSEAVLVTDRPGGGWYVVIEIASPARRDPRLISIDDDGTVVWEEQWGGQGDDEADVITPLSNGLVAAGGRRPLNPTADSDSLANLTIIDPAVPEVVDSLFYEWNASNESDRIAGITEVEDGTLAMVGEAGPQLLFAEVDVDGETLFQERLGPEIIDVEGTIPLGEGTFVMYGTATATDVEDFNDDGQMWAAEVNRGGNIVRQVSAGELYRVREVGTDLAISESDWILAGETGDFEDPDVRLASFGPAGELNWDIVWDSGGPDRDPQLTVGPDGTVWGAVVRNRDELVPLRIDRETGDVRRLTGVVDVDRVRDLWVDDERFCVALALPGDVKGGYLASFVCGVFEGDEIIWPPLRDLPDVDDDA
ncbi:MAG: hypothetical protein AAF211_11705 [Myxococcota bacterium]